MKLDSPRRTRANDRGNGIEMGVELREVTGLQSYWGDRPLSRGAGETRAQPAVEPEGGIRGAPRVTTGSTHSDVLAAPEWRPVHDAAGYSSESKNCEASYFSLSTVACTWASSRPSAMILSRGSVPE